LAYRASAFPMLFEIRTATTWKVRHAKIKR
jgi:hypothetical protein